MLDINYTYDMELHQIRHFVSVAETGSFTKGAQRSAVSQPALSASIAKLERELDVKLFDRRHQRVVLTKAGEMFLNTAQSVLLACNSVKLELKKSRTPKVLRLGVLRTLSSAKISKLLSAFRRAYPVFVIEVFDGSRAELAKRLGDRKLDLVLTSLDNRPASSQTIQLFSEPYVLAVSNDHRFSKEGSIKLTDLNGEAFILRTCCETFDETTKALAERGVKTRLAYRTDQDERALFLVSAGIGMALIPSLYEMEGVAHVPISDFAISRSIGLNWNPDSAAEGMQQFITFASSHDWWSSLPLRRL